MWSMLSAEDFRSAIHHERGRVQKMSLAESGGPVDYMACLHYNEGAAWASAARVAGIQTVLVFQSVEHDAMCFRAEAPSNSPKSLPAASFTLFEPIPTLLKVASSIHWALSYYLDASLEQELLHPIIEDLRSEGSVVLEVNLRSSTSYTKRREVMEAWKSPMSGQEDGLLDAFDMLLPPLSSAASNLRPASAPHGSSSKPRASFPSLMGVDIDAPSVLSTWHAWRESLQNASCSSELLKDLHVASHKRGVRYHLSAKHLTGDCLLRLSVAALRQPDTLRISLTRPMQLMNNRARGFVQSGGSSEPFSDAGLNGTGQVIGVADTGVDEMSCFFRDTDRGKVTRSTLSNVHTDHSHRKIVQYVAYSGSSGDYSDGHGSHVSGSLAGFCPASLDSASSSVNAYKGMAPGAKLAFFDIGMNVAQQWLDVPEDLSKDLFPAAYAAGARVYSNSWGGGVFFDSYAIDTDAYLYEKEDFLAFFAAGNSGQSGYYTVISPSIAKNVVSVGATGNNHASSQRVDYVASFSGNGPTIDGRLKPDIVAPGYSVYSAKARSENSNTASCDTVTKMGTSMATPVAAGNAALIREYFAREDMWARWCDPNNAFCRKGSQSLSGFMLKALVLQSGQAVTAYDGSSANRGLLASHVPDIFQGYGRMQLNHLLPMSASSTSSMNLYVHEASLPSYAQNMYEVIILSSDVPLKVTLAWFDPPNDIFAAKLLLHDLDLVVESPSGGVYYGNMPAGSSASSGSGAKRDEFNPNEQVTISNPVVGRWKVYVQAKDIIESEAQSYALVMNMKGIAYDPSSPAALSWAQVSKCAANPSMGLPNRMEVEFALWSRIERNGWSANDSLRIEARGNPAGWNESSWSIPSRGTAMAAASASSASSSAPLFTTTLSTHTAYGYASTCLAAGCYDASLVTSHNSHRGTAAASGECNLFLAPLAPSQSFCIAFPEEYDTVADDDNSTVAVFANEACELQCQQREHWEVNVLISDPGGAGWTSSYYAFLQQPTTTAGAASPPVFSTAQTLEWGLEQLDSVCLPKQTTPTCYAIYLSYPSGLSDEYPEVAFPNATAANSRGGHHSSSPCKLTLNTTFPHASLCVDPASQVGTLTFYSNSKGMANLGQTAVQWDDFWRTMNTGSVRGTCQQPVSSAPASALSSSLPFDGVEASCFADCLHFPEGGLGADYNSTCWFFAEMYNLCDSYSLAMGWCSPQLECLRDCSTESWCYYGAGMMASCPMGGQWRGWGTTSTKEVASSCIVQLPLVESSSQNGDGDGNGDGGELDLDKTEGVGVLVGVAVTVGAMLVCLGLQYYISIKRRQWREQRGERLPMQSEDRTISSGRRIVHVVDEEEGDSGRGGGEDVEQAVDNGGEPSPRRLRRLGGARGQGVVHNPLTASHSFAAHEEGVEANGGMERDDLAARRPSPMKGRLRSRGPGGYEMVSLTSHEDEGEAGDTEELDARREKRAQQRDMPHMPPSLTEAIQPSPLLQTAYNPLSSAPAQPLRQSHALAPSPQSAVLLDAAASTVPQEELDKHFTIAEDEDVEEADPDHLRDDHVTAVHLARAILFENDLHDLMDEDSLRRSPPGSEERGEGEKGATEEEAKEEGGDRRDAQILREAVLDSLERDEGED